MRRSQGYRWTIWAGIRRALGSTTIRNAVDVGSRAIGGSKSVGGLFNSGCACPSSGDVGERAYMWSWVRCEVEGVSERGLMGKAWTKAVPVLLGALAEPRTMGLMPKARTRNKELLC